MRVIVGAGKPTAAFALSLVGAIFILIFVVLEFFELAKGVPVLFIVASELIASLGLIFGLLILLGGIMLYTRPQQRTVWSIVVLVPSILSLYTGVAFSLVSILGIVGAILGLVGGILGFMWKPTASGESPALLGK